MKSISMLTLAILLICFQRALSNKSQIYVLGEYKINNELCLFIPSYGNCNGRFKAFAYDYISNRCILFYYSGCGGNANRFYNENTCRNRCRYDDLNEGTVPNYDYDFTTSTIDAFEEEEEYET